MGRQYYSPDRQTPLNKCSVVEPSDHRDPGSEASGPVASRTILRRKTISNGEIGLKNGGDLVEDVDREGSADATDVVARDIIEPEIAPCDPLTPKTLAWNQTWNGSDAPLARYSPLNYTVTLKLGFGVTESHRMRHH